MAQLIAQLLHPKTSAPALSRGLAVLSILNADFPCSLEFVSSKLSLPKASTLRLLETLEKTGLIQKHPDKLYSPLWKLQPLGDAKAQFKQRLEPRMDALCQKLKDTIEWYEPTPTGMQLVLQKTPESEVHVKARPGYLRDWTTEFEAVTRLGMAFSLEAPVPQSSQYYLSNGKLETISKTDIDALLSDAREHREAYDKAYNTNGVRRLAVAAFDAESRFLGILAIAELYRFGKRPASQTLLNHLHKTLN